MYHTNRSVRGSKTQKAINNYIRATQACVKPLTTKNLVSHSIHYILNNVNKSNIHLKDKKINIWKIGLPGGL